MYIKNRKKFRKVRFILLRLSKLLQLAARFRKPRRRILLVKIDAIGDYILFRNFLEVVKNSEKFKGYEIELLGNVSWKDLALEYDGNTVSQFYFIDEGSLYEKPKEVFQLGWKLFKRRYETVLQPTYSRTLMGNGLAGLAAGKTSVAYLSEHEHHPKYKKQTDRLYTELLNLPDHSWHEYERNWYFFKKATDNAEIPWVPLKLRVEKKKGRASSSFRVPAGLKKIGKRKNSAKSSEECLTAPASR
ncbi:glycosyltransferase family 9 protein [Arcticibacter sp. MXS-1]|uniref:glycosyltransferase family 9 protein n=1 Tax=Arcticibacter sp. MXS-1 TaxID=3341726 RepID=UPI0035A8E0D4